MARCRFGIVVFPGSNCDHDAYHVISKVFNKPVEFVWHRETNLNGIDIVILPGGFSYGDYLRTGAIAKFSPIMQEAIPEFIKRGGLVLGICNGFQILLESGLLPGAMLPNRGLSFICEFVHIRPTRYDTPFTCAIPMGKVLRIPIAHYEGNYHVPTKTLRSLHKQGQIIFQYCDSNGRLTRKSNPNGSRAAIAGICDSTGRILGMMPHPERASESILGSDDGYWIFLSIIRYLENRILSSTTLNDHVRNYQFSP